MKRMLLMLTFVFAAAAVHADGTADLRAALGKLPGREPLRATVTLENENRSDDEDDKPAQGRGSVEVEKSVEGVRVLYASDTITRAQQEARAEELDPEKPTPTVRALRAIDAIELVEVLDAASFLNRQLENAKLQKDVRLPNGGKAVRQLTFAVQPKFSKSDAKRVKVAEVTLVLNLGADNIPISAEMKQYIKIKVLLMSIEQRAQKSWAFVRAGDSLVAARHHESQSGSGFGQKFSGTKTLTVSVR